MPLTRDEFDQAVRTFGPVLKRSLCHLTGGREQDAEDLLQRTFERAWIKRDEFRGEALCPWLQGFARLEFLSYLRCQHRFLRLKSAVELEAMAGLSLDLGSASQDSASLVGCLRKLRPLDRRIVDLFYGRAPAGAGRAGIPLSDPEVAGILDQEPPPEKHGSWNGDRVRKRRHRALDQLRKCLEHSLRKNDKDGQSPPARSLTMDQAARSSQKPQATETLLRFLEAPDTEESLSVKARLARSSADRATLGDLMMLESRLLSEAWDEAFAKAELEPEVPLSPALEARLLAIGRDAQEVPLSPALEARRQAIGRDAAAEPDEKQSSRVGGSPLRLVPQAEERAPSRQLRSSRTPAWLARGAAMAALLLLAVGSWFWLQHGQPEEALEDGTRWRGDQTDVDLPEQPLRVWVQRPGQPEAAQYALEALEPGQWRARIPKDARIQVRITPPGDIRQDGQWQAEARLWKQTPTEGRETLPLPVLTASGRGTDPDAVLGGTLELSALVVYGISEGDPLEWEIHRGPDVFRLDIILVHP